MSPLPDFQLYRFGRQADGRIPRNPQRVTFLCIIERRGEILARLTVPEVLTAPELAEVLAEINGLAFQGEMDEFGLLRPSYRALTACMKTILALAHDGGLLRPSDISSDRNGDIRVAWAADDRETELVFPSDEGGEPYLYYSSPTSYGTETDLSPQSVSKRIHWAIRG